MRRRLVVALAVLAALALVGVWAALSGAQSVPPPVPPASQATGSPPRTTQTPATHAPATQPPADPATAGVPAERLHLTAAGDYSSSEAAGGVLERIGALKPDLHVALGDLSYGRVGEEKAWCDFVASKVGADLPFELIAGNHESNGQNGRIDAFAACLPNRLPGLVGTYGRQYYVDVPHGRPLARIILISPGLPFPDGRVSYSRGSAGYDWTAAAIDGARSAGVPWVIVGMHTICVSMGEKSCEPGPDITNLLVDKRVDLVLNAHEHFYQRSKQLAFSERCPQLTPERYNSACVSDADTVLTKGAGTVFVTAGTGGRNLRPAYFSDAEAQYFAAFAAQNATPSHGLADVKLTPTELAFSFVPTGGDYRDSVVVSAPSR